MEAEYVKINTNFLKLLEEYKLKGYVVENTNKNHVPLESTRSILLELSVKMIMNILIVQCTAICEDEKIWSTDDIYIFHIYLSQKLKAHSKIEQDSFFLPESWIYLTLSCL